MSIYTQWFPLRQLRAAGIAYPGDADNTPRGRAAGGYGANILRYHAHDPRVAARLKAIVEEMADRRAAIRGGTAS
jgi:hypothetical protein